VSKLESDGWIKKLEERSETDPWLRIGLREAHEEYAKERGVIVSGAERWGGVGGAARGVKCLHAHYAYFVAGGPDPVGEWVHARLAEGDPVHYEKPSRKVAAVDLGTNTIRLLAARFPEGSDELVDLSRDMVITRIGQGVERTGRIDPQALRRTLVVLERYCRRARALGVGRIHLAATSAVRDASNRDELAAAVERLTGEAMEVLSGDEEARLSYLGAVRGLDAPRPLLVVDIGGGSTEFVIGGDRPEHAVSTQMGTVRLTERYVHADPPTFDELDRVDLAITSVLHQVEDRIPVHDARTLVAVAGTATTMQAVALGLPEYDPDRIHGTVLPRPDAERVFRILADMTIEERRALPVMAPGREDVIETGAAILVAAMQRWGFAEAIVSETDILDGLAWRMVETGAASLP
jgi:exopolyphosphatase / guanosine-5'-triphosphate,3'-diphosphate pyrophosphatase